MRIAVGILVVTAGIVVVTIVTHVRDAQSCPGSDRARGDDARGRADRPHRRRLGPAPSRRHLGARARRYARLGPRLRRGAHLLDLRRPLRLAEDRQAKGDRSVVPDSSPPPRHHWYSRTIPVASGGTGCRRSRSSRPKESSRGRIRSLLGAPSHRLRGHGGSAACGGTIVFVATEPIGSGSPNDARVRRP